MVSSTYSDLEAFSRKPTDGSFVALTFQATVNVNLFSKWVFLLHDIYNYQDNRGRWRLSLIPLCHIHPLHKHLHISRMITAESSHLRLASGRTLTRNPWFPSASCWPCASSRPELNYFFPKRYCQNHYCSKSLSVENTNLSHDGPTLL